MLRKSVILLVLSFVLLAGCVISPGLNLGGEATAETTESAELAVNGAPPVTIDHFAGTVTVRESDAGRVTASVVKQSRLENEAQAQAQLEEITLTVEETGDGARIAVEGPDGLGSLRDLPVGMTAELDVAVPPGSAVLITLGAGTVTIDRPTGDLTIDNGAGEVTVILAADASFRLVITGGAAGVNSDFEGVPSGGVGVDIDTNIGENPTQTLRFSVGAGAINLQKAP